MRLGFDLSISQIQKLVMTPELIQAIQILQFNTQELESFIDEQLLVNPVLDTSTLTENSEKQQADESKQPENEEEKQYDENNLGEIDWKEYFKDYDDISYKQREYRDESKEMSYEQYVSNEITLSEHLLFQLQFSDDNKYIKKIGRYIVEALDSNGYLTVSIDEIAARFKVESQMVEEVLSVIQSFDPSGIAARNLQECLLLQMKHKRIEDKKLEKIISDHLHDIADNRLNNISKSLNISVEEVQSYADIIKKFEPKPGRQFSSNTDTKYIVPDVNLEKVGDKYIINVNDTTAPRLYINSYYRRMLVDSEKESQISKYLTGKLNSAMWLIKSIEQRRQTIYNVVKTIVDYQYGFFEHGKKYLVPMTLKQVAEEVGIHESTVSRAINGKYLQCGRGIFEIKFFFSSGVSYSHGQGVASESIKTMIKELVDGEDQKKPLSDQQITEMLNEKQIEISRRTIAKYREEMHIASSSKRRRY